MSGPSNEAVGSWIQQHETMTKGIMMLRRMTAGLAATAFFVLAGASSASAHSAPPCNDSGEPGNSDYARHHIVLETPGHVPGTHGGFSLCLLTGRLAHQP